MNINVPGGYTLESAPKKEGEMASKYDALANYLRRQDSDRIKMSFRQIEDLIEGGLPPAAWKHRAWWSNNLSNASARNGWRAAGWKTSKVDMQNQTLVFIRDRGNEPARPASPPLYQRAPVSADQTISEVLERVGGHENLAETQRPSLGGSCEGFGPDAEPPCEHGGSADHLHGVSVLSAPLDPALRRCKGSRTPPIVKALY